MKIDFFTHFVPPEIATYLSDTELGKAVVPRWRRIGALVEPEAHFRVMDRFDEYVQIPSIANPPIEAYGAPDETPAIARFTNDALADFCSSHRDRFPGFVANLAMNNPAAAVEEAQRAVTELGAAGCLLYTNVLGEPLSDPKYLPVFETMAALERPIWLHPIRGPEHADYAAETTSAHELWFTFGWPYETAAAMGRLVYAGLFEKLPGIKIITHHLGGLVPFLEGKIAMGFRQAGEGELGLNPVAQEAGLERAVTDYFRMFYADTAVNGVAKAFECGIEFFGAKRCVFASDAPFDPTGGEHLIRESMRLVDSLDAEVRESVYEGNARKLVPSIAGDSGDVGADRFH
jgi:predicted TIM-barrel fold metal-dependent hydrolase